MNLRLDDLMLLADVQRAGSLSAGARALGLPKSTVSRRLAALETAVGHRVFVPGARRLTLTEFGQGLAERAGRHRDDVEETRQWIGAADGRPRGRLRVWAPADLVSLLLAAPLVRYVQAHPEVSLELDTSPRQVDLVREGFDLLIRIGPMEDSQLTARSLISIERGLYAAPAYLAAQGRPAGPSELGRHRFVLLQQSLHVPLRLSRGKRQVEHQPAGVLQCNAIGVARALAVSGGGIANLPAGMVRADVENGLLEPVLPGWRLEALPVSIVTHGRRLMPAKVRAFIDLLASETMAWRR